MKRQLFFLSLSLLFISCSYAHQTLVMSPGAFQAPRDLRVQSVLHDEDGFHILRDNIVHPVQRHDVDAKIRNMRQDQLSAFLKSGYLKVNKLSDGSYKIGAHVRGLGGGPVCAWLAYWTTKATAYSILLFVGGKAVNSAAISIGANYGGPVGAEVGGAIGGVVSSGAGVIIGSGPVVEGMATCGAGVQLGTIIGGGISNAPQTIEAIEESSKVVAAAGVSVATNIAGETIAAIETGSAIVGALFSGPWCP